MATRGDNHPIGRDGQDGGPVSDEDRAFLDALARKVWQARREGALIGCLYTLCVVSMLYVALFQFGPTHPVSALCYGGVVVVLVEAYRRFGRRP